MVGGVLLHVMDAYTLEVPPPPPLHQLLIRPQIFQFLHLLLHYLPYRLCVIHRLSLVFLDKDILPNHIQKVRKLIVMGENGLITTKPLMMKTHCLDGSMVLPDVELL